MRTRVGGADSASRGRYDLVVAGQVLSELDRAEAPARRVAAHVALVQKWLGLVAENGALVIVEPALRDRTRHLHHVRDALLLARGATSEAGGSGVTVFAPCLHGGACPMLARETDWCHEDLPIDLPEWLVPVARAAGLRFEGLTFSYIVLRRDGVTLASVLGAPSMFRDVSGLLRTKGKTERTLCGVTQGSEGGGLKGMRLDRAESEANAAWTEARRGDVLRFDPPLDPEKPRVAGSTQVTRA